MKSLAAILVRQGEPLVLDEVEIPPLQFGQVLVELTCSGICGSQLGEIDGAKGPDPYLPHLLGHEGAGVVRECGKGVTTVAVGDAVVLHWRPGAGLHSPVANYRSERLGPVNAGWVTTFNRWAVVSENCVTAISPGVDPEIAALLGCAITTGFGVVNNNAGLKIGQSIVVWGAGGVGLSIVQGAALTGGHPIIAIDRYDPKLALARRLGATHTINASRSDPADELESMLGSGGADVVVDNTGDPGVIEGCYRWTGVSGTTVLVGVPRIGHNATLYTLPLHMGKRLVGSHGGEARPHEDIPNYVRLMDSDKLDCKPLVTNRFSLLEINSAIAAMREGEIAGRCIIELTD